MTYHNQALDDLFQSLNSSAEGLSKEEAHARLKENGPNELREKKETPAWFIFLRQFRDIMILILIAAAVLSGVMGDITDTVIILIIVLLNAVVGFVQEYRAEKVMQALKKMTITQTDVLRNGSNQLIDSNELVAGDVVLLEAGNIVPADMRLIECNGLHVDESSLTGESVPVDKHSELIEDEKLSPGDQFNMAFKGTLVTNGRAKGLIVATGMDTELGQIADLLQQEEAATPLQQRMKNFGKKLSYLILLICAVLFVTGILRGEEPYKILLLSVSLAVAAIPEALPALITVALSRGAARLAKKQALVRQLPAVETLGSVTFICSDKTGTLTQNKMHVLDKKALPAEKGLSLELCMSLNHDVKFDEENKPFGEPTELAMIHDILEEKGRDQYKKWNEEHPRVAEFPFDSDRKCMTTVHQLGENYLIVTKGASETIGRILRKKDEQELVESQSDIWAKEGKRVLAYAYNIVNQLPKKLVYDVVEKDLKLIGIVALMDPPRPEVREAIDRCKTAGIKVIMITGDHPATASAIAREVGILEDNDLAITGAELKDMREEDFSERIDKIAVYARVSPDQKLRIVRNLQQQKHFAAMTGDGVNDAPALKAANIGIAMGINGTDVSKEASDLVLLDDNFATIVKAIEEGRRIFDNIRKFVKYIMTCNGAEIWTIFLAPLMGMPIPLLPIHILWINLVTDGLPALALANEKAEADIMDRPPRRTNESLFSDGVGYHIIWVGLLMAGVTLAVQGWSLYQEMQHWQTMVFTVLSLSQLGHVLAVRSDHTFLYQQGIFSNLPLILAVTITFLLQMAVVYHPFLNEIFKTEPLSWTELGICIGASVIVFHAVELEKFLKRWYQNNGQKDRLIL